MDSIEIKLPAERYKAIADAIREKNGTTELMYPADMPQAILDIVSGGGSDYESIVYNEDNTITLTDKDGTEHIIECEYTDGKLTSVKYDGKAVKLTYDGDVLTKVGKTAVDMANVLKTPVTTVKADSGAVVTIIPNVSGVVTINSSEMATNGSVALVEE